MSQHFDLDGMSDPELQRFRDQADQEERRRQYSRDWKASWSDLQGKLYYREETRRNILSDPTEEERARWVGMTDEQIEADIEHYIDKKERELIEQKRLVAEVDGIARQIHIETSPRLAPYRSRR